MNTDEQYIEEELQFIEANLHFLARQADSNYIDLKVRPKDKRKKWTYDSYHRGTTKNISWWRQSPLPAQKKRGHLNGLKNFAMQALMGHFERFRDVWVLLNQRPIDETADREKKAKMRALRDEQADMDRLDPKRRCLECFRPIHKYDKKNNLRHKRVCTCKASVALQKEMDAIRSEYRASLKKRKKKDPKRYKK